MQKKCCSGNRILNAGTCPRSKFHFFFWTANHPTPYPKRFQIDDPRQFPLWEEFERESLTNLLNAKKREDEIWEQVLHENLEKILNGDSPHIKIKMQGIRNFRHDLWSCWNSVFPLKIKSKRSLFSSFFGAVCVCCENRGPVVWAENFSLLHKRERTEMFSQFGTKPTMI